VYIDADQVQQVRDFIDAQLRAETIDTGDTHSAVALSLAIRIAWAHVTGLVDLPADADANLQATTLGRAFSGWDVLVEAARTWRDAPAYPEIADRDFQDFLPESVRSGR
jgi:hypothetical protein